MKFVSVFVMHGSSLIRIEIENQCYDDVSCLGFDGLFLFLLLLLLSMSKEVVLCWRIGFVQWHWCNITYTLRDSWVSSFFFLVLSSNTCMCTHKQIVNEYTDLCLMWRKENLITVVEEVTIILLEGLFCLITYVERFFSYVLLPCCC